MMDEITLTLNSPITEDEWDMIADVDFDHTSEVLFHTKHGKKVRFVKEPPWIPCDGGQMPPSDDGEAEYLITDKAGNVRHCYICPIEPNKFRTIEEGMTVKAVAWMPCPNPWKGEKK